MEVSIGSRIKHAWNAFLNRDPTGFYRDIGVGYSYRPDRPRLTRGNERSIVTSVYNRIALDCASINIQHVRLDDSERFLEKISSGLNDCLNLSANIDQTGRAFLQDVVLSMLDEGCVAIIPVDTDDDTDTTGCLLYNSHEERLEKMKKDCNGCFGAANNDCLRCEEELQYESE